MRRDKGLLAEHEFLRRTEPFVTHAVARVAERCPRARGWLDVLDAYEWNGLDAIRTIDLRWQHHAHLREASGSEFARVVNDVILAWGSSQKRRRLPPLRDRALRGVVRSLAVLDAYGDDIQRLQRIYGQRIASVSKVYSTWDPNKWVIYDSRVGAALSWLISDWWTSIGAELEDEHLRLDLPPAQVKSRKCDPGFETTTSAVGLRRAFVYASWICRHVAGRLEAARFAPPSGETRWRAQHVEMALFVLGK